MWYSKFNQTFVNYKNKMEMHLENKIYKNNIHVSIQWVQIHVKSLREENLSHNIHISHKL